MSLLDGQARPAKAPARSRPALPPARRAALIHEVATTVLVPELLARFGAPPVGHWRRDAAALALRLIDQPLTEAIASLAELNRGGHMFRPVCRDIILPAARILRRRHDPAAFDQSERLSGIWHLRMCLLSLDDAELRGGVPAALHSVLTLSGAAHMPSVEHGVALRFFDRSGWDVSDHRSHRSEEACDSAHDHDFDIAWISLEPGMDAATVRETARNLRRASRNAGILVLGGGVMGMPAEDPRDLHLDGFTGSAVEAAAIAEAALLRQQPRPAFR